MRFLAYIMDSSIIVPGTSFRIGIDGIIGLIPGIGDVIGALISSYMVFEAARMGATRPLLIRMAFNVAVEWAAGSIPIAGDIFDFAWKANQRNMRLIDKAVRNPAQASGHNRLFVFVLIFAMLLVFGGLAYAAFALGRFLLTTIA